jgi:hypothetical protein
MYVALQIAGALSVQVRVIMPHAHAAGAAGNLAHDLSVALVVLDLNVITGLQTHPLDSRRQDVNAGAHLVSYEAHEQKGVAILANYRVFAYANPRLFLGSHINASAPQTFGCAR